MAALPNARQLKAASTRIPGSKYSLGPLALALALAAGCGGGDGSFSVSTTETGEGDLSARFELPPDSARQGIETVVAGPASLSHDLALPGSVAFNADQRATIAAGVDGVVTEVDVRLGDRVEAGQRLALISSRELARSRSAYVEAHHRLEFAGVAFERERQLWERSITSEQSYLAAQHALEEARLAKLTSGQELLALGLEQEELERIVIQHEETDDGVGAPRFMHYERRAPLAGVVVERSVVLGEVVSEGTVLFEVADLSTVWVDLRVQAAQLTRLEVGTPVVVESRELGRSSEAHVSYLDARLDHQTQTALARIELANLDGAWRPGLFVTVRARIARREVALAVPTASLHHFPGSAGSPDVTRVFVQLSDGAFEAREVVLGERASQDVEVLGGLEPGERVAVGEGLLLKSVWLGQGGLEE